MVQASEIAPAAGTWSVNEKGTGSRGSRGQWKALRPTQLQTREELPNPFVSNPPDSGGS